MGPSQGTGELSVFFQILTSRKLMESEAHFSHGALTTSLQFCGHDGLFRHVKFKSCSFRQLTLFTKLVKHNLRKSCWQLDYNHLLSMGLSTHPFLTSWLTFVFLFSHAPADWPILKKWHWNEKIIKSFTRPALEGKGLWFLGELESSVGVNMSSFFLIFIWYWTMVDLQCCVRVRYTVLWFSYTFTCI